jgi:hypothetical protein
MAKLAWAMVSLPISAGRIKLIVTEKGAGVNTVDGDIITDLSNLEITADGDLVLRAKAWAMVSLPSF